MKAYTYTRYGAPDVVQLDERPLPIPKPNEIRVKIVATTVSSGDWRARSLTMPKGMGLLGRLVFGVFRPRQPVLGTEFSGIVDAVGAQVTRWVAGDAVIGFPGASFGSHAEYITMPSEGKLVAKPDNLSFQEAAALPFGATTAYDFLVNKAALQAGENILINGASGSTGSAFVQIAKHVGATVTAVCSTSSSDLVRRIGADHVITYDTEDFAKGGARFDMIVDTVGTAPWSRSHQALVPGGRMVLVAGSTSDMLFGACKARLRGKHLIGGVASEARKVLQAVTDLAAQGHIRPVIDRCFDFSQMVQAHRHVDSRHKKGNVVVMLPEAPSNMQTAPYGEHLQVAIG